ncbi:MAG: ATP-binding protein [Planctomycetota bacterium]|jgi:serine/threonine-protein kinase RsbW
MSGSIEITSNTSAVEGVCQKIVSELQAANFSKDDVFAIHLALEEAITNAVKHGNKMDPDKKVKIQYEITKEKVEISITDQGDGFSPDQVPDPRVGENLYKFEGRGLLLIQSFMDQVKFNKSGNCLNMIRFKGRTGPLVDKVSKAQ